MPLNNQDFPSQFQKCSCSSHCLEIERYCDTPVYDEGFYVTIWSYGRNSNILGWKERFRWIWKIFRTGSPWADSVILNNEQAKQIINYINQHLPKE